jgi:D-alanyl-D-alanine dipeptidase
MNSRSYGHGTRAAWAIAVCTLATFACRPTATQRPAPAAAPQPADPVASIDELLEKPLYEFTEAEVGRYLSALREIEPDLTRRIIRLGRQNLGQPYEIYLLGEFPFEDYDPDPLYCLSKSDCVVFSEHTYAMALAHDWWSFLRTLQRIRYKDGVIGMLTRNHYTIPDWDPNNGYLFRDMTQELGGGEVAVPLTMVCRRVRFFGKFGIGQDIPDQPVTDAYIPKERVPEILDELRSADFVNIIRGNASSQWAGHTGLIARADDGTVNFLHSARPAVREQPLTEYLTADKRCLGIKILRLRDDAETAMTRALAETPAATPINESALDAAVAKLRSESAIDLRYPVGDWRRASRLQAYRITADAPVADDLQAALERIDGEIAGRLSIPQEQRAFGVLTLGDLDLAMVNPDRMFYAASVPKIAILLGYFAKYPERATDLPADVRRELGHMIKVSDNALAAKYGQLVGMEQVQDTLQAKRYRFYDPKAQTGMWYGKHYTRDSPRAGDPVHDYSHAATVRQCLRFYLMMEQGRLVSGPASARMREIFAAPELEHTAGKFVKGLQGRRLTLVRKSGTWENWHLDTARVDHGDAVYLLVGMAHHQRGAEYLAEMAAALDDHLGPAPPRTLARNRHITHEPDALLAAPRRGSTLGADGVYTSAVIAPHIRFDEALLSWNIAAPPHVSFAVEARVGRSANDSWSPWLAIADRGPSPPAPPAPRQAEGVNVEVDYLRMDPARDRLQYRVRAVTGPIPESPYQADARLRIERFDVTLCDTTNRLAALPDPAPRDPLPAEAVHRRLPVPYRSQLAEDAKIRGRICSPTSVSMVLAYRGVDRPTAEIAEAIYDRAFNIYGNWPRAVQTAFEYGVPGYLTRLTNWAEVERLIAADQPLIISIRAEPGELTGAPYKATNGHLLVITGFDAQGNVCVNDPAFKPPRDGRVTYARAELEQVWMRARHGTAYVLLAKTESSAAVPTAPAPDEPFVEIDRVDPRIMLDIRYATPDNFTQQRLYPTDLPCRLRASVADRLTRVQDRLARRGLGLKVYDGYRPLAVQRTMWKKWPDPRYVADPAKGSRHNRGAAVDVTLVNRTGRELEMPTGFDDFTAAAHRDYTGGSATARANRDLLAEVMQAEEFSGLATEWWHFDAPQWRDYPMIDDIEQE